MENISKALYIGFAMLAFVIAFSVSMYLLTRLNMATETIITGIDASYYDSFALDDFIDVDDSSSKSRIVGVDSIIPTLYRYYKESFAVKILDKSGNLIQYFDTTTESDVNIAKVTIPLTAPVTEADKFKENKRKALLSLYDNDGMKWYMFGAPWLANINKDAKTRIDMFVSGKSGYINNIFVDYTGINFLQTYKDSKFKEIFTQYAYEGDTITDDTNGEITSLTGNKQISTKIIIIYQEI